MAIHPKSLANLKQGNVSNTPFKKQLTKAIQQDLVDLLSTEKTKFRDQLDLLKPKEYCDVYLQLMRLVLPKQVDLEVTEQPHIDWSIQFVSPKPTDQ